MAEFRDDPLRTSETDPVIMDREKVLWFYMDELAIIIATPFLLSQVFGGFLNYVMDVSFFLLFMVGVTFDVFFTYYIIRAQKTKPPGYIRQGLYVFVHTYLPGKFSNIAGNSKRFEHYAYYKKEDKYTV